MAVNAPKEIRQIGYVSKDFDSIKLELLTYLRNHFPDQYSDFNQASGGLAILEMEAFVGDMLSFYIDRQINEVDPNRAIEERNVLSNAKTFGRQPKSRVPALVNISLSASVPTSVSANSLFTINKGTGVLTNLLPSIPFEIMQDVDFSLTANRTATNNTAAGTTTLSISGISAIAGTTKTFIYTAGAIATPFLKIILPEPDVTEIVAVSGSDNTEWNKVDYLAQDVIFSGIPNTTSSSGNTPFVLAFKRSPRRFVTERETKGRTSLVFGSGTLGVEDTEIIPNPEDYALPPTLRGSPSGFSPATIDPTNFIDGNSLGVAPRNIAVTVNYRVGGGIATNVAANTLKTIRNLRYSFKTANFESVSSNIASNILRSLSANNISPAFGGSERETLDEIRQRTSAFFNAQNRAVTLQDYQVIALSMPQNFGTVFRSYARKDPTNNLGVELITIARDTKGYLVAPDSVLKNNIEIFISRYRSFSDSVKLTNGSIINIGVNFAIVPEPDINPNEALIKSYFVIKNELDISQSNFNDYIVIPDMISKIQGLPEVRSVAEFNIVNIAGTVDGRVYSNTEYNILANTKGGVLRFPETACWELKNANNDIVMRIA